MFARLFLVAMLLAQPLVAQEERSFRIATGGSAGTYFPIGGLIANAISAPPGSRPCDQGGACGVPGLTATAISTNGSVANVEAIMDGTVQSGFAQSDVVTWAHNGSGIWRGKRPFDKLTAIANLYPESIHIVAAVDSGIRTMADLAGKRVSLDEPGSGTLVEARLILAAAGMDEGDIRPVYLKASQAADGIRNGTLDAFFFVGGFPARGIAELADEMGIRLISVDGPALDHVLSRHEFLGYDIIPAGTYAGQNQDIETIAVNAQWVTSADQPDDLIYAITRALWNDTTRRLLDEGHGKGKFIQPETALDGVGIPLHPGAKRFYEETGLLQ